jgi:hypothetical protein
MIERDVLYRIRSGICAIGYCTVPIPEYAKDPSRPFFKVLGTAFVVREAVAITNRHVLQGLLDNQQDMGFPDDQRALMFVYPAPENLWQITVATIRALGFLMQRELDVGFVDFVPSAGPEFQQVQPLAVQVEPRFNVSEPIAVCGYPYGHAMLQRDRKVFRWGPVVQQGYLSAISPYDTSATPSEILLDVRSAPGMSGAPIFRPGSGTVIGLLHSGWEATTALGLPLTMASLQAWLKLHDEGLAEQPASAEPEAIPPSQPEAGPPDA